MMLMEMINKTRKEEEIQLNYQGNKNINNNNKIQFEQ